MEPLDRIWTRERPEIGLVATDLDGTLLTPGHEVPDGFWQIFGWLRERGIVFCAASGRQFWNIRELFRDADESIVIAAENGSLVMQGSQVLSITPIEPGQARSLIRRARRFDGSHVLVCGRRSAWVEDPSPRFMESVRLYYRNYQVVPDLLEVEDDILKVTLCDFRGAESMVLPHLADLVDRFQVVVAGLPWLDILHRDASKGNALAVLQERLGIGPAQTMVFGDFLNDLSMFGRSTWSFAMPQAHPQVRETARFVAPKGPSEGGVLDILRRTLLQDP